MLIVRQLMLAGIVTLLLAGKPGAVEVSDLSPLAQKLIPHSRHVTVLLKDGHTLQGELVDETDSTVTVKVSGRGITSMEQIARSEIGAIKRAALDAIFAEALDRVRLRDDSMPIGNYERVLALCHEFLEKFPASRHAKSIRAKRRRFAEEYEKVKRGLVRIEGTWVNPVEATIWQFMTLAQEIIDLQTEHPDVKSRKRYADKKEQKEHDQRRARYEELRERRRLVARTLPHLMRERIPALIEKGEYEDAVAEVRSCLGFVLRLVIPQTIREKEFRKYFGGSIWEQIDFDAIHRLQIRLINHYHQAGHGKQIPKAVPTEQGMTVIPGGYFLMGRRESDPKDDRFPMHIVHVSSFLIDNHEVSNAEYRKFHAIVTKTGDEAFAHPLSPPFKDYTPEGWGKSNLSRDDQPVVGVDWFDAYAYAKWAGKRLPTESEWERAARGREYQVYPWGDSSPGSRRVNVPSGTGAIAAEIDRQNPPKGEKTAWWSCRHEAPQPTVLAQLTWDVDMQMHPIAVADENFMWSPQDQNPYGLMHLSGNAAEWVADWYDPKYYARSPISNPQGSDPDEDRAQVHVFRGGSYLSSDGELACASRGVARNQDQRNGMRSKGRPTIGFRCAKSIPSEEAGVKESNIEFIVDSIKHLQTD